MHLVWPQGESCPPSSPFEEYLSAYLHVVSREKADSAASRLKPTAFVDVPRGMPMPAKQTTMMDMLKVG